MVPMTVMIVIAALVTHGDAAEIQGQSDTGRIRSLRGDDIPPFRNWSSTNVSIKGGSRRSNRLGNRKERSP